MCEQLKIAHCEGLNIHGVVTSIGEEDQICNGYILSQKDQASEEAAKEAKPPRVLEVMPQFEIH